MVLRISFFYLTLTHQNFHKVVSFLKLTINSNYRRVIDIIQQPLYNMLNSTRIFYWFSVAMIYQRTDA